MTAMTDDCKRESLCLQLIQNTCRLNRRQTNFSSRFCIDKHTHLVDDLFSFLFSVKKKAKKCIKQWQFPSVNHLSASFHMHSRLEFYFVFSRFLSRSILQHFAKWHGWDMVNCIDERRKWKRKGNENVINKSTRHKNEYPMRCWFFILVKSTRKKKRRIETVKK